METLTSREAILEAVQQYPTVIVNYGTISILVNVDDPYSKATYGHFYLQPPHSRNNDKDCYVLNPATRSSGTPQPCSLLNEIRTIIGDKTLPQLGNCMPVVLVEIMRNGKTVVREGIVVAPDPQKPGHIE